MFQYQVDLVNNLNAMEINEIFRTLNWTQFSADAYDEERNLVLHIFNFSLSNQFKIDKVILFVISRILWAKVNLPKDSNQKIIIDIRGQQIETEVILFIKDSIISTLNKYGYKRILIDFKVK